MPVFGGMRIAVGTRSGCSSSATAETPSFFMLALYELLPLPFAGSLDFGEEGLYHVITSLSLDNYKFLLAYPLVRISLLVIIRIW